MLQKLSMLILTLAACSGCITSSFEKVPGDRVRILAGHVPEQENELPTPKFSWMSSRFQDVDIIRCEESVWPRIVEDTEDRRWNWVSALSHTSNCRLIASGVTARNFTDYSADYGTYFYLLRGCRHEISPTDGFLQRTCGATAAISQPLTVLRPTTKQFQNTSRRLLDLESNLNITVARFHLATANVLRQAGDCQFTGNVVKLREDLKVLWDQVQFGMVRVIHPSFKIETTLETSYNSARNVLKDCGPAQEQAEIDGVDLTYKLDDILNLRKLCRMLSMMDQRFKACPAAQPASEKTSTTLDKLLPAPNDDLDRDKKK